MDFSEFIGQMEEFLAEGREPVVFKCILKLLDDFSEDGDLRDDVILQSGRFYSFRRNREAGLIDSRDLQITGNQIRNGLIGILRDLRESEIQFPSKDIDSLYLLIQEAKKPDFRNRFHTPPEIQLKRGLGMFDHYMCDRGKQNLQFLHQHSQSYSPFLRFFCMHGEEAQSHHGLFQRFFHKYLTDYRKGRTIQRTIILDEAHDLDEYKIEIKYKLFEAFGMKQQEVLTAEKMQIPLLANILHRQEVGLAAVEFKVRSYSWKPFTHELIQWFTQEYCSEKELPAESPVFYFFLSIIYEEHQVKNVNNKKIFRWKRTKKEVIDPNKAIREAIVKIPDIILLKELNPVTINDIKSWIMEKITQDVAEINEIIDLYFSERKGTYDMAEVEKIFKKIIKDFNERRLL